MIGVRIAIEGSSPRQVLPPALVPERALRTIRSAFLKCGQCGGQCGQCEKCELKGVTLPALLAALGCRADVSITVRTVDGAIVSLSPPTVGSTLLIWELPAALRLPRPRTLRILMSTLDQQFMLCFTGTLRVRAGAAALPATLRAILQTVRPRAA